jgi:hypothetical protein
LVLEIRPHGQDSPGDRSVYIRSDGKVSIL